MNEEYKKYLKKQLETKEEEIRWADHKIRVRKIEKEELEQDVKALKGLLGELNAQKT